VLIFKLAHSLSEVIMDDYNFSFVHKSLTRPVVMGSMPAHWMWSNIVTFIFIGCYILFALPFLIAIIFIFLLIFIALLIHIFLCKAFAKDENYFSVFIRYLFSSDFVPSTSRVNYKQNDI
jgi:hypothetical protein